MGLSRWGRAMSGGKLAMAAVSAIGVGVLAGCSGSGSSTGSSATPGTTATASGASSNSATAPAATVTAPPSTIAFVPIIEPFDPGHPARTRQAGADCPGDQYTLATAQCYHDMAEAQDVQTDATLQARFATANPVARAIMNADDQAWLAARGPVCAKAYHTGGTTDQVNIARCLADESLTRMYVVQGFQTPTQVLKLNSASHNPATTSWYSAPDGSRIGLVGIQGDTIDGAVITWSVIAGANGFVLNPDQFYYRNGYFIDEGATGKPDPNGHRMAPGTEYTFRIDYSNLANDPYRFLDPGQFTYAPAGEIAVWW